MTRIYRWNPFREMVEMQNSLNRMFNEVNRSFGENEWAAAGNWLGVDVIEDPDNYIVTANLPGMLPEDIDITMHEHTLTIRAEVTAPELPEGTRRLLNERRYGQFRRSITLPEAVDADNVEANFHNGVLTLSIPKSEVAKPRQISVKNPTMLASEN